MYEDLRKDALFLLDGRIFKSFFISISKYATFILMISVMFFSSYLLFIDTSFLEKTGVFNNQYGLIIVCAVFVFVNIALFLLHIASSLLTDAYFSFTETFNINSYLILKACCMYFVLLVKKAFFFCMFMSPSIIVSFVIGYLSLKGTYLSVLAVTGVSFLLLFIVGLYFYAVFKQKYRLVPYYLLVSSKHGVKECFKKAALQSDGKCHRLLFLKIYNFPKKLLCLFLFPAVYFLPVTKTMEYCFLLQKEKPYAKRKSHTEKPVVFYFEPVKEN